MSRIWEAWRTTSGESAATVERLEDSPETMLHSYPREIPRSGVSAGSAAVDRLPHWIIAAPRTGARSPLGPLHPEHERKLVASDRANPMGVEQYRRLAAAVHELQVEQGLKTLMVTSAVPDEGKTLTAVNLAMTLSEACERRVLLIDADLRRPCIHQIFQLPNARGLSDALHGDGESPLMQVSEFLSVLPAGPTTEPMTLTSDRMRILLDRYAASFDWVLLDAAPVGFMPDAQLLARLTRAVLFVIASHGPPHSLVSRAIADVGEEAIIGTVLNRVEARDIPAAGYYRDH